MIAYCAADPAYFNLYFDLWATQMNKFYPKMRKIIAVYNPTKEIEKRCNDYGIEMRKASLTENPSRPHFYLLRWLNLPCDSNELILETQINCLPIRTQMFSDNQNVDHLRIVRPKRNTTGGVSAAVFKPDSAQQVVEQANKMLSSPPDSDHPMNKWQTENIVWEKAITEQQFKEKNQRIEPWCCWVTAGTSQSYTADQKLEILKHYVNIKLN